MCAIVHLLLIQKMNRFEKIGHGKTIGKREGKERGKKIKAAEGSGKTRALRKDVPAAQSQHVNFLLLTSHSPLHSPFSKCKA